jgi:hypothetical protein
MATDPNETVLWSEYTYESENCYRCGMPKGGWQ